MDLQSLAAAADEKAAYVPVSSIVIPDRFRVHSAEMVDAMAAEFDREGQLEPILITPSANGQSELLAGARRLLAARKLNWEKIQARVLENVSERSKALIMIAENEARENFHPVDQALAYQWAIRSAGITQAELAQVRGKDETDIGRYLALAALPKELLNQWRAYPLSMAHFRELLRLSDPAQQTREAKLCAEKSLSSKALRLRVDRLLVGQAPEKHHELDTTFHFRWNKEAVVIQAPAFHPKAQDVEAYLGQFKAELEGFLQKAATNPPAPPASPSA